MRQILTVVEALQAQKPHETDNHLVVFGEKDGIEIATTFELGQPRNARSYQDQSASIGKMVKDMGITATSVCFVINGMMPDKMMRPVCIILCVERWGESEQVMFDYKGNQLVQMDKVSYTDRMICAALFSSQALYHPEIEQSFRWN